MMTKYDPETLQTYADHVYKHAKWVPARFAVLGFIAGWVGDAILSSQFLGGAFEVHPSASAQWVLPLMGLLAGYLFGSGKAFELRLGAQQTLCQLQIERNTHASTPGPPTILPGA